ncbi:MAG: GntR family transcriptional regulator [Deltaproteobacteria bacterium]|nr:GntR family transcriptional regulator [Deltaproteobacteria bacterium]MBT7714510.1 GntR family transcriptional regulator [Deltaproteobacteria bacterium]
MPAIEQNFKQKIITMFTENHIPLYLKLYWKLRDDILDLEMESGERMPTVDNLHQQYGVSQGTVRKALDLLEKDGLIIKNRALGIFVKDRVNGRYLGPLLKPESLQEVMRSFAVRQTSDGWIKAPRQILNIFANEPRALKKNKIFHFQSLMINKEESGRKIFISAFFPAWVMTGLSSSQIRKIAADGFLQIKDLKGERITQTTRAWNCSGEIGEKLGLLEGTPIIRHMCVYYAADNRILLCLEYMTTTHAEIRKIKIDWGKP